MKHPLHRSSSVWVISVLISLAVAGPSLAQLGYKVTSLSGPPSQGSSVATAMNAQRQIVGSIVTGTQLLDTTYSAFLWSDATYHALGTLGGTTSYSAAINSSGQVVGYSQYTLSGVSFGNHAFLYSGGQLINLGTLEPLETETSYATGINDAGQVVGYFVSTTGEADAFLYENGTMTNLGTLIGAESWAYGINNSGQIVGGADLQGTNLPVAFLYSNGAVQNLGTLGGDNSQAMAINNVGQIVGLAATAENSGGVAFLWQNGTMINIDTLGSQGSIALAVNNWGVVVGQANVAPAGDNEIWHAFVYLNGQMYDLNDLIPSNSGWVLNSATGIIDSGQIVGNGNLNGHAQAFLLTPRFPPPIHVNPPSGINLPL